MPKPKKALSQYLARSEDAHKTSLDAYSECPAKAFLQYVCDSHDAFVHCQNKFTRRQNGSFNKDSDESLRHISCALLATIMGHFETFQKATFAGLVERTGLLERFDVDDFLKRVKKVTDREVVISSTRLLAFRKIQAPVGLLLADSLTGWHDPKRVADFLKTILPAAAPFDPSTTDEINLLWQLRHSVVHTGAWVTHPDAQKVPGLTAWAGRPVIFEHPFVNALARRLHRIVKSCNANLEKAALVALGSNPSVEAKSSFAEFLRTSSPKTVWLK